MLAPFTAGIEVADMAWEVKCREEDMKQRSLEVSNVQTWFWSGIIIIIIIIPEHILTRLERTSADVLTTHAVPSTRSPNS